jgi:hypothetical protein
MRVKMLKSYCGVNFAHNVDQEYDLPDDEAQRYISAGGAIAITAAKKPAKKPAKKKAANAEPTRESDA